MPRQDFLIGEDWDLVIENNTLKTGQSDDQHVKLLLETYRGNWTQYPLVGLGLVRFINGNLGGEFRREFKLQLEADQYEAVNMTVDTSGKINVKYNSK